jgi:hypothetical protein
MKVLSFDVGIINLAYSIIENNDNNDNINKINNNCNNLNKINTNKYNGNVNHNIDNIHDVNNLPYNIYDMGIINLSNKIKLTCSCFNKNGHKCDNIAKLYAIINNNNIYYCNRHSNHNNDHILDHRLTEFYLCNYGNCSYVGRNSKPCNKIVKYKNGENIFCTNHKRRFLINEKKNIEIKPIKKQKKMTTEELKIKMIHEFDKRKDFLDVDCVIIESQPVLLNPIMKSLASNIQAYFMIRGIVDGNRIKKVKLVQPSNKIKINNDNSIRVLSKAESQSEKYKLTKELSVQYTRQLLIHDKKNSDKFNSFKPKNDDVADSIMLAVYFLKKNMVKNLEGNQTFKKSL